MSDGVRVWRITAAHADMLRATLDALVLSINEAALRVAMMNSNVVTEDEQRLGKEIVAGLERYALAKLETPDRESHEVVAELISKFDKIVTSRARESREQAVADLVAKLDAARLIYSLLVRGVDGVPTLTFSKRSPAELNEALAELNNISPGKT